MKRKVKIIDLSVTLESEAVSKFLPPKIEYTLHEIGAKTLKSIFGVKKEENTFIYNIQCCLCRILSLDFYPHTHATELRSN